MSYKVGFIGAGNMGKILAGIVCKNIGGENVVVCCSTPEHSKTVAEELGCRYDAVENILKGCDYIYLGYKPSSLQDYGSYFVNADAVIISMLAGVDIATIHGHFPGVINKIIRIMPNTPCKIGKGVVLYTHSGDVSPAEIEDFTAMLKGCGLVDKINEDKFDIAGAITGCGPAFCYAFINALAEGGVLNGLNKADALKYASYTVLGSAEMLPQTGAHPYELIDAVCSPGGTTIEGMRTLQKGGFDYTVSGAVTSAYKKSIK